MPYRLDPTTGQKVFVGRTAPTTDYGTTETTQPAGGGLVGGSGQLYNALMTLGLTKAGTTTGGRLMQQAQYLKPEKEEAGGSPAEKARTRTGISVIGEISKTPENILKRTGTKEAMLTSFKLTFPGGFARPFITRKDSELTDLEQKYFILVQSVMTAIQGSRPSDYDVKSYQDKAGPSIKFPYYVNQQRMDSLLNLLNAKIGLPATPSRPSLGSFEE